MASGVVPSQACQSTHAALSRLAPETTKSPVAVRSVHRLRPAPTFLSLVLHLQLGDEPKARRSAFVVLAGGGDGKEPGLRDAAPHPGPGLYLPLAPRNAV